MQSRHLTEDLLPFLPPGVSRGQFEEQTRIPAYHAEFPHHIAQQILPLSAAYPLRRGHFSRQPGSGLPSHANASIACRRDRHFWLLRSWNVVGSSGRVLPRIALSTDW
jgi:hypothetical protein